jgi:hypothetical protein
VIEILKKRKGAELLFITLSQFSDADAANFAPRPCDAFGPFQSVYETNSACLLQGERLCQTKNADRRLYL